MNWKKAALAASALVVTSGAVAAGIDEKGSASKDVEPAAIPAGPIVLAPALVVAKRPSLSEILDLILRERPTAAELTGRPLRLGAFPAGSEEAHISSILRRYTDDRVRADRIAAALVREGRRRKVGSSLLVGVLLTENPWLDPAVKSSVGARGLMQVMPFHAGKWGCGSADLFDIESNICHGVAILADNLVKSRTLPQALLGYNGCVRGSNTPDCFRYPRKVYGQARKSDDSGFRITGSRERTDPRSGDIEGPHRP